MNTHIHRIRAHTAPRPPPGGKKGPPASALVGTDAGRVVPNSPFNQRAMFYISIARRSNQESMKQNNLQIQILRLVWMDLLDGEVESRLVAIPDQDGQDVTAKAERLAEEHGAVLLHVDVQGCAILYTI